MSDIYYLIIIFGFLVVLLLLALLPPYIKVHAAGGHIKLRTVFGMKLRKIPTKRITTPLIRAARAGLALSAEDLETHYLVTEDVNRLVDGLIAAKENDISLGFKTACMIDLVCGEVTGFINGLAKKNMPLSEDDVLKAFDIYLKSQKRNQDMA